MPIEAWAQAAPTPPRQLKKLHDVGLASVPAGVVADLGFLAARPLAVAVSRRLADHLCAAHFLQGGGGHLLHLRHLVVVQQPPECAHRLNVIDGDTLVALVLGHVSWMYLSMPALPEVLVFCPASLLTWWTKKKLARFNMSL